MSDIVIYEDGNIELKATVESDSIWLRQNEIAVLFGKDRTVIARHINNILKDNEVDKKSNVQKMHIANSDKPVKFYSVDIVLAVGYRTNSAKAIKFRQLATKVLKDYIIKDYALNQKRLQEQKLQELENTLSLIKQTIDQKELLANEAISNYAKSWVLLQGYDEQTLQEIAQTKEQKFILYYDEEFRLIVKLSNVNIYNEQR